MDCNAKSVIKLIMNPWDIPRSVSLKAIYTKKETSTRRTSSVKNERRKQDEEELYIGTAESEHIEMYLKALWYIVEKDEEPKISSIAKLLNMGRQQQNLLLSELGLLELRQIFLLLTFANTLNFCQ